MKTGLHGTWISQFWDGNVLSTLKEYVGIKAKSPDFDPDWEKNGEIAKAAELLRRWCVANAPPGSTVEIVRIPGKTPLLLVEVPGTAPGTVLIYGHMDKQPELTGWREGLDPWTPVVEGDRLYGRGVADDGYSVFAAVGAIRALREFGVQHARCVILIEACEESGSPDLPEYFELLADRIGTPSLIIGLDSGAGDYERLWLTNSLRGLVGGTLTVKILKEAVHSGAAGGIVHTPFQIMAALLARLRDTENGSVSRDLHALWGSVPKRRMEEMRTEAQLLGNAVFEKFPWANASTAHRSPFGCIMANTWEPAVAEVGMDGMPAIKDAGNVVLAELSLKLAIRIPPTADPADALQEVKETLLCNPQFGADVTFKGMTASGWNAPLLAPWLENSLNRGSEAHFGQPMACMGEGGTIPFMAMLGQRFPEAQFVITGVLGPESNAHGPNEFLHIPTAKRLTACMAQVLADHANQ